MRPTRDAKQRIKRMSRKIKDLRDRAQELQRQHRMLAVQHHVMLICCELLDWMRSSCDMHPGWMDYQEGLLPEELPLLEQLGANPIQTDIPRHLRQHQQAAGSTQQQQQTLQHQEPQQKQKHKPQQQQQQQQQDSQHQEPQQQQAESTEDTLEQGKQQQWQQHAGGLPHVQEGNPAPMPAHRAASCSSGTPRTPSTTSGVLAHAAAAAAAADVAQPGPKQDRDAAAASAAAAAAAAEEEDEEDPAAAGTSQGCGLGPDAAADANLSLEAFFDGAQDWELDQHTSTTPPGPSTPRANDTAAVKAEPGSDTFGPPAHAPSDAAARAAAHAPASASASAGAGSQGFDRSMLYIAAPADFLGPMRDAFCLPPYPGGDSLDVQELGRLYCSLVDVNKRMCGLLERMQQGEQVQYEGPHPVAAIKAKLVTHVRVIATVMLLHPDDVLNQFRVFNHATMQLEEGCADKAWDRMWAVVDDLGFTEHQQYLISIGCDVFKRLVTDVMQERQALAARQQELLKVYNGRSIDIQEQQTCADRMHLVVKKERFLSQCWGTYVTSVCSVVQIAKLSLKFWPYSPQIAVMGAVLSRKLEERREQQQREKEKRRRRMHGLVLPEVLAGTTTS